MLSEQSWLQVGQLELLPRGSQTSVLSLRQSTEGRLGTGRRGSPDHRRHKSPKGALPCLPGVGGDHSHHQGLNLPLRAVHPFSCPGSLRSVLLLVSAWFTGLLGSKPERVCT